MTSPALRVIAAGDPHQDARKLRLFFNDCSSLSADLFLLQGDYLAQHERDKKNAAKAIAEIFSPLTNFEKPFLALGGNYEPVGSPFLAVKQLNNGLLRSIGSSDEEASTGGTLKLSGFTIIGVDGSNPINGDHPGERSEQDLLEVLTRTLPQDVSPNSLILITHPPPYNSGKRDELGVFGLPQSYWGKHVGSESIARIIASHKPLLHPCGHVHEGVGLTIYDWRQNGRVSHDIPMKAYERFLVQVPNDSPVTLCLNIGSLEQWVYFSIEIRRDATSSHLDIEKRRLGGKDALSRFLDSIVARGKVYDRVIKC